MATTAPQTFPRKNYAAAVGAVNVKSTPKAPAALKREASKTVANVLVPKQAKVDPEAWADAPASVTNGKLVSATEEDERRLQQREKQIQFGKATLGYQLYIAAVPRRNRRKYEHPNTPDAKQVCSKRSWDGQVRVWRRALHFWDPNSKEGAAEEANQEGNDAGAGDAAAVEIDLAGSDLGGFYEADDQDDQQASSAASSAPFPPVVQVHFEPMDFGNGQDSLLGKWTANSNSSRSQGMELAGESCDPHALREKGEEPLLFVPYQFDDE